MTTRPPANTGPRLPPRWIASGGSLRVGAVVVEVPGRRIVADVRRVVDVTLSGLVGAVVPGVDPPGRPSFGIVPDVAVPGVVVPSTGKVPRNVVPGLEALTSDEPRPAVAIAPMMTTRATTATTAMTTLLRCAADM